MAGYYRVKSCVQIMTVLVTIFVALVNLTTLVTNLSEPLNQMWIVIITLH